MPADLDVLSRVRNAFDQAGYTVEGVRELLGPVAGAALARDEIVPALRGTAGGSPLEALVRLFWLQTPVPGAPAAGELVAAGLAERSGGELRALLHVEPLEAGGYVVSDLKARPGSSTPLRPDHVVGAGGASANLAQLVVHKPVDNALDLGTGCGVQALLLAGRAAEITATDVNPRALGLARMSFALSGLPGVELLQGSLFEPVRDRRFDLIVSNPPFVVSPDGRFVYRESGLPGDEVCSRLVAEAPGHLRADGWCHLLANWLHVDGQPWHERVAGWTAAAGCDAWVVERDVRDPAEYAELWLRDSREAAGYQARYDAWLGYLDDHRVTGIGFGWITLRNSGAGHPAVRIEELRHQVDQPVGGYVEQVLDGLAAAQEFSTACAQGSAFTRSLRAVGGLVQEQIGAPGAEHPERIVLRQSQGLRRAAAVGTVEAALAGVCDGTMPLAPLLEAIAELMDLPLEQVRAQAAAALPDLIADGMFVAAGSGR